MRFNMDHKWDPEAAELGRSKYLGRMRCPENAAGCPPGGRWSVAAFQPAGLADGFLAGQLGGVLQAGGLLEQNQHAKHSSRTTMSELRGRLDSLKVVAGAGK